MNRKWEERKKKKERKLSAKKEAVEGGTNDALLLKGKKQTKIQRKRPGFKRGETRGRKSPKSRESSF